MVEAAQRTIRACVSLFGHEAVALSFNGGKDSTVLLHLVMEVRVLLQFTLSAG
jgi:predicted phosphoadenosine phosphosulfate sulfurtransferase